MVLSKIVKSTDLVVTLFPVLGHIPKHVQWSCDTITENHSEVEGKDEMFMLKYKIQNNYFLTYMHVFYFVLQCFVT